MGLYDDVGEHERIGVWGAVAKPQKWIKSDEPDYDAAADGLDSYLEAVAVLHRLIVKSLLPAMMRARHSRHLSRYDLATLLGVSENTIYLWESGNRVPSPLMLSRWRNILGV